MDIITLDFETAYSQTYSLSKMTTQQYIDSHLFEVIGVAMKLNDEETISCSGDKTAIYNFLKTVDWSKTALCAHNAMFDAGILNWHFSMRPMLIIDTLSMARALHGTSVGGSLAKLAAYYEVGAKGTEVLDAKGKWRKDFSDDDLAQYMAYCRNDVDLTREIFKCMAGSFNKTEIRLIDMTIRMFTEPYLCLDRGVLEQHLAEVRERKDKLLEACGIDKDDLMSNPKMAEVLRSFNVEPPVKISARTGKEAFAFAKSDEAFKALLDHEDERVQAVVAARLGVKSTLEETRTERFIKITDDGEALPVPLKYYGAITGRWSATDSINLQNIPRGSKLKQAITASQGYSIVGADLSNIELRVGLAFAGQMDKLKMLGDGLDLYKDFASKAFSISYDDVDDDARFVGKTASLSLIYGTGAKKLRAQCKMLSGKDIGEDFAQHVVDLYRDDYAFVKAAWHDAGKALDAIIKDTYTTIGLGELQLPVEGSRGIKLPSGLYMTYPELKEERDETGRKQYVYKTYKGPVHIHAAKCYQNVIQALARCVMGEDMVRVNKLYPVALTIHDAVYCVVDDSKAEQAVRDIVTELRKAPAWLADMPLDAEGGYGKNLSFKMKKVSI